MTGYLIDIHRNVELVQMEKAYIENLCALIRKENEVFAEIDESKKQKSEKYAENK